MGASMKIYRDGPGEVSAGIGYARKLWKEPSFPVRLTQHDSSRC